MRILVLAPHPFYVDRGTPIDVELVLRVLCGRPDTEVDLLVYAEGTGVELPNLRIHRTVSIPGKTVRPGFSPKKMACDILMFFQAWKLVRKRGYDLIHAGEEAVFFAMFFGWLYKIPYAYDLDSSIAQQLVEKIPLLRPFQRFFDAIEGAAVRRSLITFPVCNALADLCKANGSPKTVTLHDISQLEGSRARGLPSLRDELELNGIVFMYIGNLEEYQGIDLLLESMAVATRKKSEISLVIVGGRSEDIASYRRKSEGLGIEDRVHFLGPRPLEQLADYLASADVLVCPRIRGINTPMKVFPYLHSGKPVLATDLPTHNQILSSREAYLAGANPKDFGEGMIDLAEDASLRSRLGRQGQAFVERQHTFEAHKKRLNDAYDWIEAQLGKDASTAAPVWM